MTLVLRSAVMADAAALTAIQLAARTSADIPNLHTAAEDLAFHQGLIAGKKVMVAEREGVPVGFAVTHDGWLDHLWILPAHHRQGIGRALLAWARTSGDLKLYVFTHNTGPSPSTVPTAPCRSRRATGRATRSAFPT